MGDYNNRNDRGRDRGGRRFGGGRDFGRREMHHATCAQCGKDCEVPFRPSEDRPVYCSDCFEKRRNENGDSRGSSGRNFGRPNFDERKSYSGGSDRGNARGNDNGQLMDQLKSLHIKLDKILSILEPRLTKSETPKKEATEKSVKPKAPKIEVTDIVFEPKVVKPEASKKKAKEEKVQTEETVVN